MRLVLISLIGLLFLSSNIHAQNFAYGLKGGLSVGFQEWDNFERQPLFRYHGIAFIESASEDQFGVLAQLGYHENGSANRSRNPIFIDNNGNISTGSNFSQQFIFRNITLTLGAKKKHELNKLMAYYMLGIRGNFTVGTNLEEYETYNQRFLIYPVEGGVKKLSYGVMVGGGFEFPFGELVSGLLEFTINPDLSQQYYTPPLANVRHPITNETYTVSERTIKNVTLEVTVGIRFLNKVVYVD